MGKKDEIEFKLHNVAAKNQGNNIINSYLDKMNEITQQATNLINKTESKIALVEQYTNTNQSLSNSNSESTLFYQYLTTITTDFYTNLYKRSTYSENFNTEEESSLYIKYKKNFYRLRDQGQKLLQQDKSFFNSQQQPLWQKFLSNDITLLETLFFISEAKESLSFTN